MIISNKYKIPLVELGLEPKAADIYLSALQIGGGTIMEIAKAGDIERTGIYHYLKKLTDLNLLKITKRGKRTLYIPADPSTLQTILRRKQAYLNEILPGLSAHFSLRTGKSIVTYYQGSQEIINLYEQLYDIARTCTPEDRYAIFGHSFEAVEALPDYFPAYIKKISKLQVETRVILPQSERPPRRLITSNDKLVAKYTLHAQERRYISSKYPYPGTTFIIKDFVGTIDFKTFFGTLTENRNHAQTWRTFFEFIWDHLPTR